MPNISYSDLIQLQEHRQYIDKHHTLPANIDEKTLLHLLISHPDPTREILKNDPVFFIKTITSYDFKSLILWDHDSDDAHIQQLNLWIESVLKELLSSFFQENTPFSRNNILALRETPWINKELLQQVDISAISSPDGLANLLFLGINYPTIAKQITHTFSAWPDEQRYAFYRTLQQSPIPKSLQSSLLKKDKAYFQSQTYSLVSYMEHWNILNFFNIKEKVTFQRYTKSLSSFYKTLAPYEEQLRHQWTFIFKAFLPEIDFTFLEKKYRTISPFCREQIIEYYFDHVFQNDTSDRQLKAIHFFWNFIKAHGATTLVDKNAIKTKIQQLIFKKEEVRNNLSPLFQCITDGKPIDIATIPAALEYPLKNWIKQYQPDIVQSLQILGIKSARQIFLHYNRSTQSPLEEVPLHFT